MEDFPCNLGVKYDTLAPIVLQDAEADEKVFADLSSCKVDFSIE